MSKPRSIRTRKRTSRGDIREETAHRSDEAPLRDRPGVAPSRKAAKPVPVRDPEVPVLATDDLLAIAEMDPGELAALMEGAVASDALEPGQAVRGTVTRVEPNAVLVDIGAKSEAWIDRAELGEGVQRGDSVEAFVVYAGESEIKLSKQLTGDAASAFLEEAYQAGIPVEGRVVSANAGGFEVRVGDRRAFCPRSLISRAYVEEPSVYVGQTLTFKVIEIGDKTVLSRRAVEEEQAERFAEAFWQKVHEGMELEGTVRSVQPFGAFVDLGGVDGLIPRSELSWEVGVAPADLIAVGEQVRVRVLAADPETKKLTLSLKNPDKAPWRLVGDRFVEGGVYEGEVVRITGFGAFVRLAEGLDGLLHRSKMPADLQVGAKIDVKILGIDHQRQRISLGRPSDVGTTEEREQVRGTVVEVMRNGVVVRLEDGRSAWLPVGEVELPAGTVLSQRFRRGKTIEARVKDASRPDRLILTTREAVDQDWRAALATKRSAAEGSFGTLGDLFANLDLPRS